MTNQSLMVDAGRDIACGRADRRATAQKVVPLRRPGAQPGNSNRLLHGLRSRRYREGRRLAHASLKLLHHVAYRLGVIKGRNRARPLRADQLSALAIHEPQLLALALSLGLARLNAWERLTIQSAQARDGLSSTCGHPITGSP